MKFEYDFGLMAEHSGKLFSNPTARFYFSCFALDDKGKRIQPPVEAKQDLTYDEMKKLIQEFKQRETF